METSDLPTQQPSICAELVTFLCRVLNELQADDILRVLPGVQLKRTIVNLIRESDIEEFSTWTRIESLLTKSQRESTLKIIPIELDTFTKRERKTYKSATLEELKKLSVQDFVRYYDLNFHEATLVEYLFATNKHELIPPRIKYDIFRTKVHFDSVQEQTLFTIPEPSSITRIISFNMLNFGENNSDRKDHQLITNMLQNASIATLLEVRNEKQIDDLVSVNLPSWTSKNILASREFSEYVTFAWKSEFEMIESGTIGNHEEFTRLPCYVILKRQEKKLLILSAHIRFSEKEVKDNSELISAQKQKKEKILILDGEMRELKKQVKMITKKKKDEKEVFDKELKKMGNELAKCQKEIETNKIKIGKMGDEKKQEKKRQLEELVTTLEQQEKLTCESIEQKKQASTTRMQELDSEFNLKQDEITGKAEQTEKIQEEIQDLACKSARQEEVKILCTHVKQLSNLHNDCEIIVTGDFNLAPTDRSFNGFENWLFPSIESTNLTTIYDKECYDNIWTTRQERKHKGVVLRWDDSYPLQMIDRLNRIMKYCSDHRPVQVDLNF
jgi:hypothetical protein